MGRLVALALAVAMLAACGGPSTARHPGPRVAVSTRGFDLGIVIPGERIARVLSLKNTGSAPLIVTMIRTSGRRLVVPITSLSLPPGGSRDLPFEFRAEIWEEAAFREWIMIYSNDPVDPLVKVRVQGGLQAPVSWTPKFPMVGFTRRDKTEPIRLVQISARDRTPIGPVRVTSLVPFTQAKVTPVGPEQYRVDMTLDPDVPLGPLVGWVRIDTAHPKLPTLLIPVRATVLGDLYPRPYQFDFGIVEEGTPAVATITLRNQGARTVHVLKVEPQLAVPARVTVTPQGKSYRIIVQIPSAPPRWSLKGVVNIFTDHPREPVVQVPAVGWVAAKNPFALADGNDADLFALLKAALLEDENKLPSDEIVPTILGGVSDDRTVSLLLRALKEEHFLIRQRATEVLGLLKSRRALEVIRAAVTDDEHSEVRRTAAAALAEIAGREALPTLLLALQDNDDWVRDDAADLLGQLGDRRAIPALQVALKDESKDVRATAARSLKALAGESPGAAPTPPPP